MNFIAKNSTEESGLRIKIYNYGFQAKSILHRSAPP